ncbi:MAG: ATP-binding protein, partial [Oscillospiraceae bacterium]|nr:ATP-binding protein [Oscillospiraceae bacterium]
KSRSRALGGTGLGLSIVKHAAALHGAEVSLDSRPGVGTSVRVCFPPESGAATDGRAGEVQA